MTHPPAILYSLNRQHVAAEAICALCDQRAILLDRIRSELSNWNLPVVTAWLFGSAARGEGDVDSDIDILVVRPENAFHDDPEWEAQLAHLSEAIPKWSGNAASVIEYTDDEVSTWAAAGERLVSDVRGEGIHLGGRRTLLAAQTGALQ